MQGLLPALAPILPHLAEDAWQNLPWGAPQISVFQGGWRGPCPKWREGLQQDIHTFPMVLAIRQSPSLSADSHSNILLYN